MRHHFAGACIAALLCAGSAAAQDRQLTTATAIPSQIGDKTVVIDQAAGTGAEAERGLFVVIDYDAWIFDAAAPGYKGKRFDSTRARGYPLSVLLGLNRMISGLDRGLVGMRTGGRRTLVIPPRMAYGERGAYDVPPRAVLIFEVDLLDVVPERNVP